MHKFIADIEEKLKESKQEYKQVENLPLEFYAECKELLTTYRDKGCSQQWMIDELTILYKKDEEIEDFVFEILDIVHGHCATQYKIFDE